MMTRKEAASLAAAVQWAIQAFEQANTNDSVERLSGRGCILAAAMADLRAAAVGAGIDPDAAVPGTQWVVGVPAYLVQVKT